MGRKALIIKTIVITLLLIVTIVFTAVTVILGYKSQRQDKSLNTGMPLTRTTSKEIISEDNNITKIIEIRSKNFELLSEPNALTFGEAIDTANWVSTITSIRPAFLLSIFQEELKLEKSDLCYLTDFNTGEGIRISDNTKIGKVMKPDRDIQPFLNITKKLGKDPSKTLVTCPMSFGWGGAMGPADFIPSTWMEYKPKIEKLTGKPADPWNIQDAFLAAGLYLSDSGAKTKTQRGEWDAAMIYFSGSANSPYTWYADGAMKIANEIQVDIDKIKSIMQ
jgi:hypothetical protein